MFTVLSAIKHQIINIRAEMGRKGEHFLSGREIRFRSPEARPLPISVSEHVLITNPLRIVWSENRIINCLLTIFDLYNIFFLFRFLFYKLRQLDATDNYKIASKSSNIERPKMSQL